MDHPSRGGRLVAGGYTAGFPPWNVHVLAHNNFSGQLVPAVAGCFTQVVVLDPKVKCFIQQLKYLMTQAIESSRLSGWRPCKLQAFILQVPIIC